MCYYLERARIVCLTGGLTRPLTLVFSFGVFLIVCKIQRVRRGTDLIACSPCYTWCCSVPPGQNKLKHDMAPKTSKSQSWFVILLVVLFGSGSWVTLSGIWSEVPTLIASGIPEQYRINSFILIAIQMANMGPVFFLVLNHYAPKHIYRPEIVTNYVITTVAAIATLILVFCWNSYTVWSIDNQPHSTALLSLVFCVSFVDITANLTFVGFMSLLKPHYLNWYWVGQGCSALLPAVAVIIQNGGIVGSDYWCAENFTFLNETQVGNESLVQNCTSWITRSPRTLFGPEKYFGFLFVIMMLCLISYICLNTLPCAKREYNVRADGSPIRHDACGGLFTRTNDDQDEGEELAILSQSASSASDGSTETEVSNEELRLIHPSTSQYVFLFITLFADYFLMYGVFSSIQSFSASAYGHSTFTLITVIREIIKVVGFMCFLFKPICSFPLVAISFLIGCAAGLYCLAVAIMNPSPPLQHLFLGKVILVGAWTLEGLFMTYCRAAITWIIRNGPNNRTYLIWSGAVSQLAVLIGAVMMFILINVYKVFHARDDHKCLDEITCEFL